MATIWVKRDDWMTVAQAVVTRELEAVDWKAWQWSFISSDLLLYI